MPDRAAPRRGRRTPDPPTGPYPIDTGVARFVADGDGRRGWTLMVNDVPSSHVDLDDPLRLDFEYMRWMADVLDLAAPPGAPLRSLHLGGAGCTLPRYLAAARPRSPQLVVELDAGLIDVARRTLALGRVAGLRLRAGEAREVLTQLPSHSYDVVVRDAFRVDRVPQQLTTRGFVAHAARVLDAGGVYLANLADTAALDLARAEAATALAVFRHVALIGEPAHFHGRRYGNLVLVGSAQPLPIAGLDRRLAGGAVRARLLVGREVTAFSAGHRPIEDGSPAPVADARLTPGAQFAAGAQLTAQTARRRDRPARESPGTAPPCATP